ncbi:MAG: Desulfoferrodoxin, N-terminal domain [Candidatus Atribacteria bacterium]|nr:Desulfoferrodoxin, N-terminal domain [Candidatus Atribacteria bacterium]
MAKKGDVYRCDSCGHEIEVKEGTEDLVCCGQSMTKVEEPPKKGGSKCCGR